LFPDDSSEFVADAIPSPGKPPFDVQVGTADPAGTALQATFIIYTDALSFDPVYVSRTEVKALMVFAF